MLIKFVVYYCRLAVGYLHDLALYKLAMQSFILHPFTHSLIHSLIHFQTRGHPWYSGSALDYWPTGRAIDPAPGA